jgi:hypothetical protein
MEAGVAPQNFKKMLSITDRKQAIGPLANWHSPMI